LHIHSEVSHPDIPVAIQAGSIWDYVAAAMRGVFDGYLISRDVDPYGNKLAADIENALLAKMESVPLQDNIAGYSPE